MSDDVRRSGEERRKENAPVDSERRKGVERRDLVRNYDRIVAFLKSIRLFSGLNEEYYRKILRVSTRHDIRRGHFVYEYGDESDAVYILIRGKLQDMYRGRTFVTNITPVGFFGAVDVFTGTDRLSSVSAVEDSTILSIHKYEFFKLLYGPDEQSKKVLVNIIRELSHKIVDCNDTIEILRSDQGNVIV